MMEAHMADVINLKRFKKRSEREQSAKQAETNRARFGRTKAEKQRDSGNKELARSFLDGHRRDRSDGK